MNIKSNLLKFISIFCILALMQACSEKETFSIGSGSGTSSGSTSGADYSGLTAGNHPRIMMTDDDVAVIKAKLSAGTDSNLTTMHEALISYADQVLSMDDLTRTLSGHRLLSVCREAANRIIACAYAYRLTGETKYLEQAEHDLATVAEFYDWNAGQHFLDVGEMAYGVGIGYDWLYNELSATTKSSVVNAIVNYAFTPALNFTTSQNFYGLVSNWNQVCNGGLVCCALAIYESSSTQSQEIIDRAVETNKTVMEGLYSPDGNYPEGYGYWEYGTAYQCILLSAMETCLGTDFNLSQTEGFSKTGEWVMFMEGLNSRAFNFYDCAASSIVTPALWYLASKFNDSSFLYYEVKKVENGMYASADSRYLPMAITYASKFDLNEIPVPSSNVWSGNGINPVVLIHEDWSFSDTDKFLGIKAGRANYSHGQMDVGSFVYDIYGARVSADLGLQSYSTLENLSYEGYSGNFEDYSSQNSFRWACFRYNNYNHSTLTINDNLHKYDGTASITSVINTDTSKGAVIDLSDILSNDCQKATRTITLESSGDLIVTDVVQAYYNSAAKVRWTMVTMCVPQVESDRIILQSTTANLALTVTSANGTSVTLTEWSTVGASYDVANTGYYEVGFTANVAPAQTETFTVTISPVS